MRSEAQPLLGEKEGSGGSNNSSGGGGGGPRRSSAGEANPDALSLDMPTGQLSRRATTGSTASGVGIDIRYSPGTGPGLGGGGAGAAGGGGPYDHPTASYQVCR